MTTTQIIEERLLKLAQQKYPKLTTDCAGVRSKKEHKSQLFYKTEISMLRCFDEDIQLALLENMENTLVVITNDCGC